MASPNVSEIISTTLNSRTKKLADNVTKNTALLARLRSKGKVKPFSGGNTIYQELEYQENSTYQRYSGYDTVNISPSDVITSAEFNIKQSSVAVTISGLEQLQNSGIEKMIDLLEARISNAEKTMINNIASDCYSDGTASGGKQIGGLKLLVSSTPTTGTVGGISRVTWPFWQNVYYSGVTNGGAATSASNIQSYMNNVYVQLVRNNDKPDLIVADNNYWTFYLSSLQAIQRITSVSTGEAGFTSLKYMSSDVMLDGGFGGFEAANNMFFLNTDYIFFRPHRDRNFTVEEGDRVPVNQDAIVKMMLWAGNMTLSNASLQGLLGA
jgi:hypothetical protein